MRMSLSDLSGAFDMLFNVFLSLISGKLGVGSRDVVGLSCSIEAGRLKCATVSALSILKI